jgi:FMN phosphatase YigB (HAD superfamily)
MDPKTYPVLSLDVFDTSVARLCIFPDHLHWFVGEKLGRSVSDEITPVKWRRCRIHAERVLRVSKPRGEVTLEEIYDVLQREFQLSAEQRESALRAEVDLEIMFTVPIADTLALYRARLPQGSAHFLSDSYLPQPVIVKILQASTYEVKPEVVTVSSSLGLTKASGELFAVAIKAWGVEPGDVLHIGDNLKSDIANSHRAGVGEARHIDSTALKVESSLFESAPDKLLGSLVAGSARTARLASSGQLGADNPYVCGSALVGPVLAGFVAWVLSRAMESGRSEIFFIARDGQLLFKMAEAILSEWKLPLKIRYMYGSRQSFFLAASLASGDLIGAIAERFADREITGLLEQCRFSAIQKQMFKTAIAAAIADEKRQVPEKDVLRNVLSGSPFCEHLFEVAAAESEALLSYLKQQGFDPSSAGIVDLGWMGNLQVALERVLGAGLSGFYFGLAGKNADLRGSVSTYERPGNWNGDILEAFCMADHGSTISFRVDQEGIADAVTGPAEDESAKLRVRRLQNGAVAYTRYISRAYVVRGANFLSYAKAMEEFGKLYLRKFLESPEREFADIIGEMEHARDQTHAHSRPLAPRLPGPALLNILIFTPQRRACTSWLIGTVARSGRSPMHWVILTALRLLAGVKRRSL